MRSLLKRWYVWLAVLLLAGLTASGALMYSSRSPINQENFDRICEGMTREEVEAILGGYASFAEGFRSVETRLWLDGPSRISVSFNEGKMYDKDIQLASVWEWVKWHARNAFQKLNR